MSTEDLIRELEANGVLAGKPAAPPVSPVRGEVKGRARGSNGLALIIVAAVLVAVIGSLPFGSYALYPFALFVTLLHETGHALAAVATGGSVAEIRIRGDLSGLTLTSGGIGAFIASAGYLGASLAGATLLVIPVRWAKRVLGALAMVPILDLLVFHPADAFTAVWCAGFASALLLAAWKLPGRAASFLQIALGVEASLNAFRDLNNLIFISGNSSHIYTDAKRMSELLFLPPIVWAAVWTFLSVVLLLCALMVVVRRDLGWVGARSHAP